MDEEVTKEPARTIIYAKGTDRPIQSMSNILVVGFRGVDGTGRVQKDCSLVEVTNLC
jgi:hypothetical protein